MRIEQLIVVANNDEQIHLISFSFSLKYAVVFCMGVHLLCKFDSCCYTLFCSFIYFGRMQITF